MYHYSLEKEVEVDWEVEAVSSLHQGIMVLGFLILISGGMILRLEMEAVFEQERLDGNLHPFEHVVDLQEVEVLRVSLEVEVVRASVSEMEEVIDLEV